MEKQIINPSGLRKTKRIGATLWERGINESCCSFQVEGSLITNILSILFAFMGIVILSVSLAGLHPASEQCEQSKLLRPTEQYHYHHPLDNNDCSSIKNVLTVSIPHGSFSFWK